MNGHAPVGRLEEWSEVDDDAAPWPRFERGEGPAVIVLHELHGITPEVLGFGDFLARDGFHVVIPHLFGVRGERASRARTTGLALRMCVSLTFRALALGSDRPIARQLRAFAASLAERTGGQVGVVGMCFTGGFALAMAVDDEMLAPVLSQPSLPFPVGKERARALGLSDADLAIVAARENLCVLAMRFTEDRSVPKARFDHLREVFGDRLIAIEIDSSDGNPYGNPKMAHSVVTEHLVDEPGHPTRDALDRVLSFFRERLAPV